MAKHTKAFITFVGGVENSFYYAYQLLQPPNWTGLGLFANSPQEVIDKALHYLEGKDPSSPTYPRHKWLFEVIITRAVDGFEHYLSQALRAVFVHRREQLTSFQISMKEVLEASSIDELIEKFAEKKARDLVDDGLDELVGYLNKKVGLRQINPKTPDFHKAQIFVQVRHLIVHNAGRVDERFLDKAKKIVDKGNLHPVHQTPLKAGELYPFTEGTYLRDGIEALLNVAEDMDTQIISKFHLADIEEFDRTEEPG